MKGELQLIHAKFLSNEERIDEVNKILREVFIEELKYNNEAILDEDKSKVFHVLLYEGLQEETAVATGRLVIDNNRAEIKLIAVKKNYRNRHYGDMVVRVLVDKALLMSISDIYAVVPQNLTEMFKKIGFISIDKIMKKNINNNIEMKFNKIIKNCNNNMNN